jgi:CBS domain-containing protein
LLSGREESSAKVRDVMVTNVDRVSASTTVFEAARIMNDAGSSGVVVFNGDKAVGMVTDRRILRRFIPLNKSPDSVTVLDIMSPFFRIDANATTKEAKKRLLKQGVTRLGVFEGEKFLGWVTLAEIIGRPRGIGKNLFGPLTHDDKAEPMEVLCPNCRSGFMERIENKGEVVRYQCLNCNYSL